MLATAMFSRLLTYLQPVAVGLTPLAGAGDDFSAIGIEVTSLVCWRRRPYPL